MVDPALPVKRQYEKLPFSDGTIPLLQSNELIHYRALMTFADFGHIRPCEAVKPMHLEQGFCIVVPF